MSNPLGDSASLYILYVILSLFVVFFIYRLYKCLRRENSTVISEPLVPQEPESEQKITLTSRNSSVDNIFNEFHQTVSIKPNDSMLNPHLIEKIDLEKNKSHYRQKGLISISCIEEGVKKNNHINALLNLLAVKETNDSGLNEAEIEILKNNVKIFTHEDFNSDNMSFNTTGNIENLSKSFCLNNDINIRNKPSCMYCLENLNIGDRVIYLNSCKHLFHETCCIDWFSKKRFCPSCKKYPFIQGKNQEDGSFIEASSLL